MFFIVVKNASFCLHCLIDLSGNSVQKFKSLFVSESWVWLSETSTVTMSFLYLLPSVGKKHKEMQWTRTLFEWRLSTLYNHCLMVLACLIIGWRNFGEDQKISNAFWKIPRDKWRSCRSRIANWKIIPKCNWKSTLWSWGWIFFLWKSLICYLKKNKVKSLENNCT